MTGLLFDTIGFTQPRPSHYVPDTSKAAHTALVNAGKLNGRKAEVLDWLLEHSRRAPVTAAELSVCVHGDFHLSHVLHIRRGLSDLKAVGLITKGTDRQCAVTSTKANTWRVIGR